MEDVKEIKDIEVSKEKFDAVLSKLINSRPIPLKDVVGTLPNSRKKPVPKTDK